MNTKEIKFTLFVILLLVNVQLFAKDILYQVAINGKNYKGLFISVSKTKIEGQKMKSTDTSSFWTFKIPDLLYNTYQFSMGYIPMEGENDSTTHSVQFYLGDKSNFNTGVFDASNKLSLTFHHQTEEKMGSKYRKQDWLAVDLKACPEFDILGKHLFFSWFNFNYKNKDQKLNYEEFLSLYKSSVRQYPNSRYLLSNIDKFKFMYKTPADLASIFNEFSATLKSSKMGKNIKSAIDNKVSLVDYSLLNSKTGMNETVVADTTVYNLIVFSATWCVYCHKLIPMLKQAYSDLSPGLKLTYITLDKESEIDKWNALVDKKEIPWRSLLIDDPYLYRFQMTYGYGIPVCILVYPGSKKVEELDLSKDADKEKLYSICRKKQVTG